MKPFKLDDIDKKRQPYEVPPNYFEDLPMKIQQRIETSQKTRWNWIFSPTFRLAASITAVLVVVLSITLFYQNDTAEDLLSSVTEDELIAYIDLMALEEDEILTAFENTIQVMDFSEETELDGLEIEDESLDDLMNTYDLTDEYL